MCVCAHAQPLPRSMGATQSQQESQPSVAVVPSPSRVTQNSNGVAVKIEESSLKKPKMSVPPKPLAVKGMMISPSKSSPPLGFTTPPAKSAMTFTPTPPKKPMLPPPLPPKMEKVVPTKSPSMVTRIRQVPIPKPSSKAATMSGEALIRCKQDVLAKSSPAPPPPPKQPAILSKAVVVLDDDDDDDEPVSPAPTLQDVDTLPHESVSEKHEAPAKLNHVEVPVDKGIPPTKVPVVQKTPPTALPKEIPATEVPAVKENPPTAVPEIPPTEVPAVKENPPTAVPKEIPATRDSREPVQQAAGTPSHVQEETNTVDEMVRAQLMKLDDGQFDKRYVAAQKHPLFKTWITESLGLDESDYTFGVHNEMEELITFEVFCLERQQAMPPPVSSPVVPAPEIPKAKAPQVPAVAKKTMPKKVTFAPIPNPPSAPNGSLPSGGALDIRVTGNVLCLVQYEFSTLFETT